MCNVTKGSETNLQERQEPENYFRTELVWRNIYFFVVLHGISLVTIFLYSHLWTWNHLFAALAIGYSFEFAVTVGAHRLWAHKCYKAKLPLRIVLMLLQAGAAQNNIYTWSRDHRLHHKFVETDADPHTTTRGMFFAHMGWLMMKKHPAVMEKGRTIDCSDLLRDPVVAFQIRYYKRLAVFIGLIIPMWIHWMLGASLYFPAALSLTRWTIFLHGTWCINSLAHWFGDRPYDPNQKPANNPVMKWFLLGEGFHNYHHVFPFDYKATEMPFNFFDMSAIIIDCMAFIGQAYDLRKASHDMIKRRKQKQKLGQDEHIF